MTTTDPRWSTRLGLVLAAVTMAILPAGCTGAAGEDEEEAPLFQTKLKELDEFPGHHEVTFSEVGVERADVRTSAVTGADGTRQLPYAALLYNADGSAFVYQSVGTRTYRYTPITLKKVANKRIYFTDGPAPGAQVVTSGVPQVHGADIQLEFGEIA